MEGTGFKSIFVFLLLALLAFVAGSLASDSARDALVPSVIVLGLFFLVFLGKNCWWLIMVLPPVLQVLDFPILQKFPIPGALAAVILFYWFIMSVLGYAKFTWNGVKWVDISVLVFVSYFLFTWVRHPVTVLQLVSSTDFSDVQIGGVDYFFCIGAIFYYLALSVIPLKVEDILKALKIGFWLSVVATVFMCVKGVAFGSTSSRDLMETAVSWRFDNFIQIGQKMCYFLFAKYSLLGIIFSPVKLVLMLLALLLIALSGFRSAFMSLFVYVSVAVYVKRQLCSFFLLAALSWGSVIYLSYSDYIEKMPYGVQRVCTAIPGVHKVERAAIDAQGSLDWRTEMWEWAFDPSKGYIKDYVWGDGFELPLRMLERRHTAMSLGLISDTRIFFAEEGQWHSGYITAIHRIGYVGLVLLGLMMVALLVLSLRLSLIIVRCKNCEYALIYSYGIAPIVVTYFIAAGTFTGIFQALILNGVVLKVLYSLLMREWSNCPLSNRERYVPLIFK